MLFSVLRLEHNSAFGMHPYKAPKQCNSFYAPNEGKSRF